MTRRLLLAAALLAACHRAPPSAMLDADQPRQYRIGVATGQGDAMATSLTTLRVVPRGDDVFAFVTEHSEGTWEEGAAAMQFDSDRPKRSDPWPVTLQHAVASVPAPIRVDERGQLVAFLQQDSWRSAARTAVEATELPPQASLAAERLLDPEGVLRDLRRNFPGVPEDPARWTREETIAGIPMTRVERCETTEDGRQVRYTCTGTLEGDTDRAKLVDGTSTTTLVVDREGLVDLEMRHEGTLVMLAKDGKRVLDRPVMGVRKVVRQDGG